MSNHRNHNRRDHHANTVEKAYRTETNMQPRKSASHGSAMIALGYREVKSRFSIDLYCRLSDWCAGAGISQSEALRRAVEILVGGEQLEPALPTKPTNGNFGPSDPSNPLA